MTSRLMQIRSRGAVVIDVILLIVLLALLPETLDLDDDARRFPLVTTVVLAALLALDLLIELVPGVRRRLGFLEADYVATTAAAAGESFEGTEQPLPTTGHRQVGQWAALAWLTGAGVAMFYLGYLVTTPVFLALFFFWARVPVKVAVGITLVLSVFNYVVFYEYLGLR